MSYGQYSNQPKPDKPDVPKTGKRMKHVFGARDTGVEHIWAHPENYEQTDARNPQHNFYFKTEADNTRVLYSYRDSYPIGSTFMHGKRRIYLIFSGSPYSVTTASHIRAARAAIPTRANVFDTFEVKYVYDQGKLNAVAHKANLTDIIARMDEQIDKLSRVRSSYRMENARDNAIRLRDEAKRYARLFKIKLPKLARVPALDKAKLAKAKAFEANRMHREHEARERQRKLYEEQHAQEAKQWEESGYCKHDPHHTVGLKYECEHQTKQEDWDAHKQERIAEWKQGQNIELQLDYYAPALLRVVQDGNKNWIVQTSHHVSVPVSGHAGAFRLLQFLQARKQANRPYERNGHTEHIGNFSVDSFGPDKGIETQDGRTDSEEWILKAGCHRILWEEIESIADTVILAAEQERNETIMDAIRDRINNPESEV